MLKLAKSPFIREIAISAISISIGLTGTYLCNILSYPREAYANYILVMALFLICGSLLYTIRTVKSSIDDADEYISSQNESIRDCLSKVKDLSEKTANCIQDAGYRPTIMQKFSKELILNDDIISTGKCKFVHTLRILNMHEKTYQNYIYTTESSEDLSDISGYRVHINNKIYTLHESDLQRSEQYVVSPDAKKSGKKKLLQTKGCRIKIPVGINHEETKEVVIEELECPSFGKLKNALTEECLEYISSMIYYPTDKLTIKVTLEEGTLAGWILDRGNVRDAAGDVLMYKITDRSEQVMESYGHDLKARNQNPHYSEDHRTLIWTVSYPKIGCRYRLYFRMVKQASANLD